MNALQHVRNRLKQLEVAAPSPEARLLVRRARKLLKMTTHFTHHERWFEQLQQTQAIGACFRGISDDIHRDMARQEASVRRLFYTALDTALTDGVKLLDKHAECPDHPQTMWVHSLPHFIGSDEATWLVLCRAVDLWQVKEQLLHQSVSQSTMKALYWRAVERMDNALMRPQTSARDAAYHVTAMLSLNMPDGIAARHRLYLHPTASQRLRADVVISCLIMEEVIAALPRPWQKGNG